MYKQIKRFPPKSGISPYYSPRIILHQKFLDYVKSNSISFGSYVQAHNEPDPKNSQHPRTLDCIYLCYFDNKQGGHNLLDIRSGRTIKLRTVSVVFINCNMIELVHQIATNIDMKDGLNIKTNSMTPLGLQEWTMFMITMIKLIMTTIQLAPTSMTITLIKIMMT
jgi:hypothetical protein